MTQKRGRPKIGEEIRTSIPVAQIAQIDAIAEARHLKRVDVLREAIACYLKHCGDRPDYRQEPMR